MKYYWGPADDDPRPLGGGAYNKNHVGLEVFNFSPIGNSYFAHIEPPRSSEERINLKRIDPNASGDSLDDVTVIFVAPFHGKDGLRIVGWYRGATVFREKQSLSDEELRKRLDSAPGVQEPEVKKQIEDAVRDDAFKVYYVQTKRVSAVLLPEEQRQHKIPTGKGAFGQANVWYRYNEQGKPKPNVVWAGKAIEYIESYQGENVADGATDGRRDQRRVNDLQVEAERRAGYQTDPEIRKAVEQYAMVRAKECLERDGYVVQDTHLTKPYDLLCTKDGDRLYAEVKGTQVAAPTEVFVTRGEVCNAQNHRSALFVVYDVRVERERGQRRASGGEMKVISPWKPSAEDLEAVDYRYRLPKGP